MVWLEPHLQLAPSNIGGSLDGSGLEGEITGGIATRPFTKSEFRAVDRFIT